MNKVNISIDLSKLLASSISSREIISDVLEKEIKARDADEIFLDFSKIDFVSRSATHELLKLKEKVENSKTDKKQITFIYMNPDVATMVRTVAANRAYPKNEAITFEAEKIDILRLI